MILMMEDLLTPREVAQKLRVTEDTVKKYINTGQLEGIRVGGRWRIRPSSLERYLNNRTTQETDKK